MADPAKEIAELRQALSGRTVSCEQCNTLATENQAMREAIREAHAALEFISSDWTTRNLRNGETIRQVFHDEKRTEASLTLAKLKPFITTKL